MLESLCVVKGFTTMATQKQIARGYGSPTQAVGLGQIFGVSCSQRDSRTSFPVEGTGESQGGGKGGQKSSYLHNTFTFQFSFRDSQSLHHGPNCWESARDNECEVCQGLGVEGLHISLDCRGAVCLPSLLFPNLSKCKPFFKDH